MPFRTCPVLPQQEMSTVEFQAWLKQFDADRDGRLSREELQHALRSLSKWSAWWKAREALRAVDTNRNEAVDKEEMGKLVCYAQQHLHMKIYAND